MVALVAIALGSTGCVDHAVGPAWTQDDFARKAGTTIDAARSVVQTVLLVAETAAAGDAFGTFVSSVMSEQEDAFVDVRGDFDSIQPPDTEMDAVRVRVEMMLDNALDHIVAVRIAVRRGELAGLADIAEPLHADVDAMNVFLREPS